MSRLRKPNGSAPDRHFLFCRRSFGSFMKADEYDRMNQLWRVARSGRNPSFAGENSRVEYVV